MEKIKISAVSYLNTIPFIYGIEQSSFIEDEIELSKDMPAECARKLLHHEVDLGLIPVATLPDLKNSQIISDYCIGAVGKVHSVLLVSDVPLNEIDKIYLDYQSRTSVKLCQILCKQFWNIEVEFIPSEAGYEQQINGNIAGVIIGDRTFNLQKNYEFVYDLSEEWMKWQNLPFVFAAWVSNRTLSKKFVDQFNQALQFGLDHKKESLLQYKDTEKQHDRVAEYIENQISYTLDADKKKSLEIFLKELSLL